MQWKRPPTSLEHVPSLAAGGLLGRYLCDPEFARRFYGAHPGDLGDLRRRVQLLGERPYPRGELASILRRQNAAWGMSGETEQQIALLERGAFCVFTGQQTGLFTGPLYTVYKALSTVRWARHLSAVLSVPVVPVFWLAADDHDLGEIDHAVLFDGAGQPQTLRHEMTIDGDLPRISRLRFGQDIGRWLDDALGVLPEGPGRDEVREALTVAYQPGRSWADAFGCLMARWLGKFGLILVTPDDRRLKRLMAPVFLREIRDPEGSRRAVEERDEKIRRAGYRPQVGITGSGTLLFLDDEAGARRRIDIDGDRFTWAGGDARLSRDEMEELLDEQPERFSAGALLRSVSGDAVFPTVAHVMGPGEIAYMAQARVLYERHDLPMPLVVPRARFTIIPEEIEAIAREEGISLEDAFQPFDRWIGLLASQRTEREFGEVINACRRELDAAYGRLEAAVGEGLPGMRNAATSARIKTQALMNKLERKIEQEMRRRERRREVSLRRIADALYPTGSPQERVYAILPYIARYGVALFDAVLDTIDVTNPDHRALWPEG